jgi:hypothetical protein
LDAQLRKKFKMICLTERLRLSSIRQGEFRSQLAASLAQSARQVKPEFLAAFRFGGRGSPEKPAARLQSAGRWLEDFEAAGGE